MLNTPLSKLSHITFYLFLADLGKAKGCSLYTVVSNFSSSSTDFTEPQRPRDSASCYKIYYVTKAKAILSSE